MSDILASARRRTQSIEEIWCAFEFYLPQSALRANATKTQKQRYFHLYAQFKLYLYPVSLSVCLCAAHLAA